MGKHANVNVEGSRSITGPSQRSVSFGAEPWAVVLTNTDLCRRNRWRKTVDEILLRVLVNCP